MNRTVLNTIAILVSLVWVANFIEDTVNPTYDGSAINQIFPLIIGAALALKGDKNGKNGDQEESKSK